MNTKEQLSTELYSYTKTTEEPHKAIDDYVSKVKEALKEDTVDFIANVHYDGFLVELTYEENNLVKILAIEDSHHGKDITQDILSIKTKIPEVINSDASTTVIRAELVVSPCNLSKVNSYRESKNLSKFKSSMHLLIAILNDPELDIPAVEILPYFLELIDPDNELYFINTFSKEIDYMVKSIFYSSFNTIVNTESSLKHFYDIVKRSVYNTNMAFSSVVIRVNRKYHKSLLDAKSKHLWAIELEV